MGERVTKISQEARQKLSFAVQDAGPGGALWAKFKMCLGCAHSGGDYLLNALSFHCRFGDVYQVEALMRGSCPGARRSIGETYTAVLPEEYRLSEETAAKLKAIIEEGKTALQEEKNRLISR